jgi:hypothetical protein
MTAETGALAAALSEAQAAFPAIPRDKEVTVQTKTGGTYTFKYAPLEVILAAVRKPLTDNGLALVQTFDDGDLVTTLFHKDGGAVSGRLGLPEAGTMQALGSAITYLRRYSVVAILGIATEEDDDGNLGDGNTARVTPASQNAKEREQLAAAKPDRLPANEPKNGDGSLIGTAELAKDFPDFLPKMSPDGSVLAFKLVSPAGGIKVIVKGDMADILSGLREGVIGQRVSCWGRVRDEMFTPKGSKKEVTYQVLDLERIKGPEFILPAQEAETVPLFGETV